MEVIKNRYEFVVLFDVENGNPNGDPDAGNMPRIDVETGYGLVTDVCLKRKIRNYVETVREGETGYRIYIKDNVPLDLSNKEGAKSAGVNIKDEDNKKTVAEKLKSSKKDNPNLDKEILDYMCKNFFDIRTFGAVMTTYQTNGLNCGQVRGPVQMGFAKSIDTIIPQEVSISRIVSANADDPDQKGLGPKKYIVPYALYKVEGFISANLARKTTGFSEEDLELLWNAIMNMFEFDRAAARGKMATRELIIFKHDSEFGNAPAHKLFDLVKVEKKEGVDVPRSYSDYIVSIDEQSVPNGVHCKIRQ